MWNTNTKLYVQSLALSFRQPIQNLSSPEEIWQPCNTRKHSILRAISHQMQHPFRLFLTKAKWFIFCIHNPTSSVLKYRLYFDERVKGFGATKIQKQSEREEKILSLLLWIDKSCSFVCCKLLQAKTLPHDTLQYQSLGRLLKILLWCCAIGRKVWKEEGEREVKEIPNAESALITMQTSSLPSDKNLNITYGRQRAKVPSAPPDHWPYGRRGLLCSPPGTLWCPGQDVDKPGNWERPRLNLAEQEGKDPSSGGKETSKW